MEEAISRVLEMTDRSAIVAKPPLAWGSEAKIIELTDGYTIPQEVTDAGYEYLVGREDLVYLLKFLRKKRVSTKTKAEFVIHYALTDSTPAWIDDIPEL
jgi:hypothetical protein